MAGAADQRELVSKVITKFRGISQYRTITGQPMEWAQDLLNVIVSGAGFLEKLRSPVAKSAQVNVGGLPQTLIDVMYDFQKADGTRQLVAAFPAGLGHFTEPVLGNPYVFAQIEANAADYPRWSFIDSNNLLFGTNGVRMRKWTGAALQNWGIVRPATPPQVGITVPILHIQRTGNVITVDLDMSGFSGATVDGFNPMQLQKISVGDTVTVQGVVTDATANGSPVVIAGVGVAYQLKYNSVGGNFGPVTEGSVIIYSSPCANIGGSTDFTLTERRRVAGTVVVKFTNNYRLLVGEGVTLAGFTGADAVFNGTFILTAADATTASFLQPGPDVAAAAPTGAAVITGGFTDTLGARTWRYSYGNSVTGEESAVSDQSLFIPNSNNGLVSNVRAYLTAVASPDGQVDTLFWYATLDSGSDWFLDGPSVGFPVASGYVFGDGNNDDLLDVSNRGSFINLPPPLSILLSKWQGRIYMVPVADQQTLAYTGYEKILRGRPESCVPPFNVIRLNIGANVIKGHGPLMNGVVIWDSADRMFMFKGTVEDIVTGQPVNYSEQLEEMPWEVGCMSHQTVQSTPYGVIWFGSDKVFHKWNGIFYGEIIGPVDISQNIYPLLARITPGTEGKVQSAYFNFLERDWYVALIAVDGSQSPNRILFFDVSKESADNLGVFISDIQADAIVARTDANNIRHLLVSIRGLVYEIKAATTATAGIHTAATKTANVLDAFWLSGYDGSDTPLMMKLYRFGRLICDQSGFSILATLIDDETSTLAAPVFTKGPYKLMPGGKFSVNWKARRLSLKITFPNIDVDASVLQLAMSHIPGSER